jgi:hypothetical protein
VRADHALPGYFCIRGDVVTIAKQDHSHLTESFQQVRAVRIVS